MSWKEGMVGVGLAYGYGVHEDPAQLKAALTKGPVAVTIDADSALFRDYESGIIDSPACGETLGHAVLAIGYGKDNEKGDFVIIKNSWGTSWGENGYVKISLTQKYGPKGICGVLSCASIGTNKAL